LDTADTNTIDGGDVDVALVSPRSTPGVSDNVVVLSIAVSITNGGDGVIKLGSASSGVEDTRSVALEDGSVGLDGNGGGSGGDGSLEVGNGSGTNGGDGLDVDLALGGIVLASSGSGSVWVSSLELLAVSLDVVHGVGLPTTLATIRGGIAVNNLLLGEGEESAGGNEVVSLNGGGGREGPAGTALTLVLDGVDGTLGSPVDGVGEVVGGEGDNGGLVNGLGSLVSEESLVLILGPGGELIVSNGEGVLGVGVDLVDLSILLGVESESELVLFLSSI